MPTSIFEKNIASLDFTFKKRKKESGVILTANYEQKANNLSPQELFALETASRFSADAVYFRYFNDGRELVPQIYIYDNTDGHLSGQEAEIHKKVWSGCYVPLFIIIEKTQIKIFDSREKVHLSGDTLYTNAIDTIKLTADVLNKFSAKSFDDGLFWEEKTYKDRFQYSSSAYKDLIDGLKKVYVNFQSESKLSPHVALKLLVQCLLIKYLEERDESKSGYFAKTYFKNHFNCNNFCEVISTGKLLDLLDKLATDFNGKIFEWNIDDEKKERTDIKKAQVKKLADYLDGNNKNSQYVLWRLYSFSHLPVELISSVYEELLGKGNKDMVYTPDVIASTLIDECMPLKMPKKDFKLIDISCGSGIFLVKAYKRIIQWWRYENWKKTGVLEKPDLNTLKQLLTKSIYGIDISEDAVRLSVFSLALALLDELDPPTIWTKLKFENINEKNIWHKDFFEFITSQPTADYDLVIGNPPFNPPFGLSNGEYYAELKEKYNYESKIKIPDFNPALMFLVEALNLLKPKALLCLIQPSGPLMYQNDEDFKKAILTKYNLLQIVDFTKLGDVLWGKANVATAAIFLQNSPPDEGNVAHIIASRTSANLKKLFLELDHYDFHFVDKASIISNPYVWKANSIGGGRIVSLIERLSSVRTLGHFLEEKKEEGWKKAEGFIEKGDLNLADYITEKDFLPTDAFTEKGIDWSQVHKCDIKYFHRPRIKNKEIYSPSHLLIRKVLGKEKLISEYSDKYLTFLSDIFAIHAPVRSNKELKALAEFLNSNSSLLRFYILATSSRVRVNKATSLYDEDILNLPYPEKLSEIKLSKAESILIDDVQKNILIPGSENKLNHFSDESQLKTFAKTLVKTLNSVYQTDRREFKLLKLLDAGKYYALHFEYTAKNYEEEFVRDINLGEYIQKIISPDKRGETSTHIQRILKVYRKDTIILAKPKNLRYWLQSIGLRDGDEMVSDYINAGF